MLEKQDKGNKEIIFGQKVVIYLCFYFGIAAILDFFLKIKFLGLSFFVTILPYSLLAFVFFKNLRKINALHKFLYVILVGLFLIIVLLRSLYYNENLINLIGTNRYVFFVPLVLMLFERINFDNLRNVKVSFFLFIILAIHAVNSVFYISGLPFIEHVDVLADDYVAFGRFGGIMGGANVQAVFTSTIYLILVLSNWRMSLSRFIIISIVAIVAVMPTVSKGGALILLFGLSYYVFKNISSGSVVRKISLVTILSIVVLFFMYESYLSNLGLLYTAFSNRLEADDISSGRWERLDYFWSIINENLVRYFIGAPGSALTQGGNDVSDNVFTLLPVNFGFVFSLIFFSYMAIIVRNYYRNAFNLNLFLLTIFIVSLVNNSIIWTAWSYYVIFGFFYLLHTNKVSKELVTNS
ncbi:hypothetical protein [Pedobacter sp. UBA4863]|uniref:hypothetical protein n=1 Tax=Pedobacter sp. UBA4863 TaxID=1947060 RepID=UPI0025E7E598|nr:hypothetical protein [Pedobacter sp. UBA4863]